MDQTNKKKNNIVINSTTSQFTQQYRRMFQHLIAGAVAGGIADFTMHPVDTIRTRIQIQRTTSIGLYKNSFDAFRSTVRLEGWSALYKGIGIVLAGTIPAHGLYFVGYELAKSTLQPNKKEEEKSPLVHFLAGVWADICGSLVWVPMDVIKQRMQAQKTSSGKYSGSLQSIVTVWREEGTRGFFRGYWAALATYAPSIGIYFVVYEQCKKFESRFFGIQFNQLPFGFQLVNGAFAGAISAALTCPMDVIKTRLQVQNKEITPSEQLYKSGWDAFIRIMKEEGPRAFHKRNRYKGSLDNTRDSNNNCSI